MTTTNRAAIILAAGAGTRMKSKTPKVAHEILGKPLVCWVVDAAKAAGADPVITLVGHGRDQVVPLVEDDCVVVDQKERLGTADAVASCAQALEGFEGSVVILYGDTPMISAHTIEALADVRERENSAAVVLTMKPDDPFGYGRIVRDQAGDVLRIVEQRDATADEAAIRECNSGMYCFDAPSLFRILPTVDNHNAKGEYYLTDVIALLRQEGSQVTALEAEDTTECLGINSRVQLADAAKTAQSRINRAWMEDGVTMMDRERVWIGPDVVIQPDVELLPQVYLMGSTSIGEDSVIGPNTRLTDTVVGCGCRVDETVALESVLDDRVTCGPRAYLRPGVHMCEGSKAGTHVEIKKSTIGAGSKVPHLSYIGDTLMGSGVNVGAGSITCNYDGANKHRTVIGDNVFIGSDTMMVAPVTIGDRALIGAGSVITKDVSEGALGLGRARQSEIEGWADRFAPKKHK